MHLFAVIISGNIDTSTWLRLSLSVPTSLMHAISSIMPFDKHVAYDGCLLLLALQAVHFGFGAGEGTLRVLDSGTSIISHLRAGEGMIPTMCYFSAPALRAGEGMLPSLVTPFAGEGFTPVTTALTLICSGVTVAGQPAPTELPLILRRELQGAKAVVSGVSVTVRAVLIKRG